MREVQTGRPGERKEDNREVWRMVGRRETEGGKRRKIARRRGQQRGKRDGRIEAGGRHGGCRKEGKGNKTPKRR